MITNEQVEAVGNALPKEMETSDLGGLVLLIMHAYLDVEDVPKLLRAMADDVEGREDEIKKVMADVDKDEP